MTIINNQFQHFVSKFYLRGWQVQIDSKPNRVWVYEKGKKPRHGAVKNVAGEENFYAIREFDGTVDNSKIEQFLGVIESKAGGIFPKLERREIIDSAEKRLLAEFLTIFWLRSPVSKSKSGELVLNFLPKTISPLYDRAKTFSGEKKERAMANIAKVEKWYQDNPTAIFPQLIGLSPKIVNLIEKMDWTFLTTKNAALLTCDTPFIYNEGSGISDFNYGHIIFPINRTTSLEIMNSSSNNNNYFSIEDKLVADINTRIIKNAHKQVYASYYSEDLDKYIQAHLGETST